MRCGPMGHRAQQDVAAAPMAGHAHGARIGFQENGCGMQSPASGNSASPASRCRPASGGSAWRNQSRRPSSTSNGRSKAASAGLPQDRSRARVAGRASAVRSSIRLVRFHGTSCPARSPGTCRIRKRVPGGSLGQPAQPERTSQPQVRRKPRARRRSDERRRESLRSRRGAILLLRARHRLGQLAGAGDDFLPVGAGEAGERRWIRRGELWPVNTGGQRSSQPVQQQHESAPSASLADTAGVARAVGPPPTSLPSQDRPDGPCAPSLRAAASKVSKRSLIALKQQRRAAVSGLSRLGLRRRNERKEPRQASSSARCCTSGEGQTATVHPRSRPAPDERRPGIEARCDRYSRSLCARAQPRRYGAGWRTGRSPAPPCQDGRRAHGAKIPGMGGVGMVSGSGTAPRSDAGSAARGARATSMAAGATSTSAGGSAWLAVPPHAGDRPREPSA